MSDQPRLDAIRVAAALRDHAIDLFKTVRTIENPDYWLASELRRLPDACAGWADLLADGPPSAPAEARAGTSALPRYEVLVGTALIGVAMDCDWLGGPYAVDLPATLEVMGPLTLDRTTAVAMACGLAANLGYVEDPAELLNTLGNAYDELALRLATPTGEST